jgi:hypothetical protein
LIYAWSDALLQEIGCALVTPATDRVGWKFFAIGYFLTDHERTDAPVAGADQTDCFVHVWLQLHYPFFEWHFSYIGQGIKIIHRGWGGVGRNSIQNRLRRHVDDLIRFRSEVVVERGRIT